MRKEDINELRKAMKTDLFLVDWIYGFYLDPEGEVRYEEVRDANLGIDEEEMNRHFEIMRQVLSGGIGKRVHPAAVTAQSGQLLEVLRKVLPEPEDLKAVRDAFCAALTEKKAFYVCVMKITYSMPSRASDGAELEDGGAEYRALLLAACPAKLTPAALGFTGTVEGIARQWVIHKPVLGFLYPSFNERAADNNEVMIRSNKPETAEFIRSVFALDERRPPVSAKTQQEMVGQLFEKMEMSMEDVIAVTETLAEENMADGKETVEKEDLLYALSRNDVDTAAFDDAFEETIGEVTLMAGNAIPKNVTIKSELCRITIHTDKAALFERREIDGKEYLLIPVEGTVVVNDTATTR